MYKKVFWVLLFGLLIFSLIGYYFFYRQLQTTTFYTTNYNAAVTRVFEFDDENKEIRKENQTLEAKLIEVNEILSTPVFIVVTATKLPTPLNTPTITLTPTPKPTSTPTVSSLKQPKSDGFYLIGVDIAPGIWRSTGSDDGCYWEITTSTGDIIDNHFGMSGGTAYIPESGFQVVFEDCGNWILIK